MVQHLKNKTLNAIKPRRAQILIVCAFILSLLLSGTIIPAVVEAALNHTKIRAEIFKKINAISPNLQINYKNVYVDKAISYYNINIIITGAIIKVNYEKAAEIESVRLAIPFTRLISRNFHPVKIDLKDVIIHQSQRSSDLLADSECSIANVLRFFKRHKPIKLPTITLENIKLTNQAGTILEYNKKMTLHQNIVSPALTLDSGQDRAKIYVRHSKKSNHDTIIFEAQNIQLPYFALNPDDFSVSIKTNVLAELSFDSLNHQFENAYLDFSQAKGRFQKKETSLSFQDLSTKLRFSKNGTLMVDRFFIHIGQDTVNLSGQLSYKNKALQNITVHSQANNSITLKTIQFFHLPFQVSDDFSKIFSENGSFTLQNIKGNINFSDNALSLQESALHLSFSHFNAKIKNNTFNEISGEITIHPGLKFLMSLNQGDFNDMSLQDIVVESEDLKRFFAKGQALLNTEHYLNNAPFTKSSIYKHLTKKKKILRSKSMPLTIQASFQSQNMAELRMTDHHICLGKTELLIEDLGREPILLLVDGTIKNKDLTLNFFATQGEEKTNGVLYSQPSLKRLMTEVSLSYRALKDFLPDKTAMFLEQTLSMQGSLFLTIQKNQEFTAVEADLTNTAFQYQDVISKPKKQPSNLRFSIKSPIPGTPELAFDDITFQTQEISLKIDKLNFQSGLIETRIVSFNEIMKDANMTIRYEDSLPREIIVRAQDIDLSTFKLPSLLGVKKSSHMTTFDIKSERIILKNKSVIRQFVYKSFFDQEFGHQSIESTGNFLSENFFYFQHTPKETQLFAENAGFLLSALGITNDIKGGSIHIQSDYGRQGRDENFHGKLQIKRFKVVHAPLLAQLVSFASLTGLINTLNGAGIGFDILDMPFYVQDGKIHFNDSFAEGEALGVKINGFYNIQRSALDIEGALTTMHVVNKVVRHLPLYGELLTGGSGGGILGIYFTITGDANNPHVSVNPLSVLTPGYMKRIFEQKQFKNIHSQQAH